jgi:molecular chaperone HtpG
MSAIFSSRAEKKAKKAEDFPQIFGSINLTSIRENVSEILKLIGRDGIFREYTLHDANHIDEILLLVDKLIPAETAAQLKTADWLMIVLSCYFHDLGMLVTKKEFENRYNGTDFPLFKSELLAGDSGKDYEDALERLTDEEREEFLYQEFVRKHHAKRIFHWVQGQEALQFGDAASAVGAINSLLAGLEQVVRDDLAKLCLSHHEEDLFDFNKYQINRVYGDDPEGEANLHYAALILRAADVLQIQKKRVPPVLYKLIDPSNPKSQEEWAKQAGVRAVKPKISPSGESDTVEVHASFDKESAYFGLLAYLQQFASKELERCYDWARQAQKKGATFRFPWRQIDTSQVEPRGFEGRSYSFGLDQEKILKLLTGHTLYNDSRVAIREVLQNALDAVRFRKYSHPGEPMGKIEIIWMSKERKLTIRDTGTGMTQDTIEKFLLNVGSSYYQSETVLREYAGFSSISRFGIGVLSTFMIADEVQILTVHPDDEFARKLTLPSVVKSYLVKKIQKSDAAVRSIGAHGTEVTLQVRRSADLRDIEDLVRYWLVIPGCEVTCAINDSNPVRIGFLDAKAVIDYYYGRESLKSQADLAFEVRAESAEGIDLSYVISRSSFVDVWYFARDYDYLRRQRDEQSGESFSSRPGLCVEGIRVRSEPAGYDLPNEAPWIFANLTGRDAPKTNVARSDVEQNPEFERALFRIYSLLGSHVQSEFRRLLEKGTGVSEAASVADRILCFGLERSSLSSRQKFDEAMATLEIIALEDGSVCRAVGRNELDLFPRVWTVDSRLIRDVEGISGALGIDLPADVIIGKLGREIQPPIPRPRVLGKSKGPLATREVEKFLIHREDRSRRVDISWSNEGLGRWIRLPTAFVENIRRGRAPAGHILINAIFMTRDKNVSSECSDFDLVIWRDWCFLLATSPALELFDILGMNEAFARWLGLLMSHGEVPLDQRPVLKEILLKTRGTAGEELLSRLSLPFERRFGDASGRRGHGDIDFDLYL